MANPIRPISTSTKGASVTPSLPHALALAIRLAVMRQARLRAEARRTIRLVKKSSRML